MKKSIYYFYEKMSIKTKWILFVIILVLYPMILIGYVGYKNYEQVITNHFVDRVQSEVQTVGDAFGERIQDLESFVTEVQQDRMLYEINQVYYKGMNRLGVTLDSIENEREHMHLFNADLLNNYELKEDIEQFLMSLLLSRQDITVAAYQFQEQTDSGYIVSKDKGESFFESQFFKEQKIFDQMNEVLEDERRAAYIVAEDGSVYIGKAIYFRDNFRHTGNLIFKLDMEYLLKQYMTIYGGAKEAVFLINDEGKTLLSLGDMTSLRQQKLLGFLEESPELGIVYKEEEKGEAVVFNTFASHNLEVASAIYISKDILLQEIRAMSRFMFMLCISILPIFLLIANKLYKEIIYPVYILSEKMHSIEKGEIGTQIHTKRSDEIGYVFNIFNRMSKQIHYLVNCVYKEQLALKNAELKALQTQINPHFLYNTLEMINWKARMAGVEDLSEMIEALSTILEINIDRREEPFIKVKEELNYLKNYMFLLQKRYGDRIQFDIQCEKALMEYKLPRLLLQPLVENALTHGVEPIGEGKVDIHLSQKEQYLIIWIKDTGVGMTLKRLSYIKQQLTQKDKNYIEDENLKRGHIGIINVQRRIQLLYGPQYGLELFSEEGKGTTIEIKLPLLEGNDISLGG